jgi:flagellar biosynthetic protein FlhB
MMSDASERTEQATPKRMKEVREKGKLGKSSDLVSWLSVGAGAAMIPGLISAMAQYGTESAIALQSVIASPDPGKALEALGDGMGAIMPAITPMLVAVAVAAIAGSFLQGGIHFKKFAPDFEHFNPITGFKRMFGLQAAWEGVKAVLKTAVVGGVLVIAIQGIMPLLMTAGGLPVSSIVAATTEATGLLMQAAIAAGLVLAGADLIVVMFRNRKQTLMTKKEVTDENKNAEGDPMIRAQRKARQLQMSRNRMIAAVGGADVVLLNPTHIAVALKYEPGKAAPRVVAKGADAVALKIREKATESGVPMVEDIPLARALHAACEIGDEIPPDFYAAVARVLAFVMSLKARGAARGAHRLSPQTV